MAILQKPGPFQEPFVYRQQVRGWKGGAGIARSRQGPPVNFYHNEPLSQGRGRLGPLIIPLTNNAG
jgi:hypothetical protein